MIRLSPIERSLAARAEYHPGPDDTHRLRLRSQCQRDRSRSAQHQAVWQSLQPRAPIELVRRFILFTQLNHRRAARSQSFDLLGVSEAAESYVCNGIVWGAKADCGSKGFTLRSALGGAF